MATQLRSAVTLPRELEDAIAKIFADACAERTAQACARKMHLTPKAAVLCLRMEFEQLLHTIDLMPPEERDMLVARVSRYNGNAPGDFYESLALHAYTCGFSIPMEEKPSLDEYLSSLKSIIQR